MAALQITPRCWRHSRWHRQTGPSRAIYLRSCNAPPALDLLSIISFSTLSTSRAARLQLTGEGKGCALPWSVSAELATRNHSGAAAAGRKERGKTHQTGPLLTQSVIGAG